MLADADIKGPASVGLVNNPLECAEGTQALVLMTEWQEFIDADWEEMARRMKSPRFFFDGRNALDQEKMQHQRFDYQGVGRGATTPIELVGHA